MHHVYIMTHTEYRDMLVSTSREIAMCKQECYWWTLDGRKDLVSEKTLEIQALVRYRHALIAWWYGSRIGSPPPRPSFV
jgi:hypothetical protein